MVDTIAEQAQVELFGSKLFEWLATFGVQDASARARQVAQSFVREGWTLNTQPGPEVPVAEFETPPTAETGACICRIWPHDLCPLHSHTRPGSETGG